MENLENKVKTLVNNALTCEVRRSEEITLESLTQEVTDLKTQIKDLNRLKRERGLSFGEVLTLNVARHNLRGAENLLLYKQAQQRQNTTGPVSIFNL